MFRLSTPILIAFFVVCLSKISAYSFDDQLDCIYWKNPPLAAGGWEAASHNAYL